MNNTSLDTTPSPQSNCPPGESLAEAVIGTAVAQAAPVPTCIGYDDRPIQSRLYDASSGIHCIESLLTDAADAINKLEGEAKQLRANLKDANRRASKAATAEARCAELEAALTKEREAVARFLVPWRHRLADTTWLQHFVDEGIVTIDGIGYVKAAPLDNIAAAATPRAEGDNL